MDKFLEGQSAIEKDLRNKQRIQELKEYEGEDKVVYAEEAQKLYEEKGGVAITTGVPFLDDATEGFREGELVIVSGPTKNGKTSFCQTISKKFSTQVHVLWFPFEGGYRDFFNKYPGNLDFYIPQKPKDHSLQWVEDRIIEAKHKFDTKVVFIDNLDFLYDNEMTEAAGRRSSNFATYVGGMVKRLKEIAMEQEVIIFLMVHLAKAKWTKNSLPESSDIRDSSRIPQLSDFVIMIMRKKNDNKEYIDTAIVGVIENRHTGKTKIKEMKYFNGEFTEVTTKADGYDSEKTW